MSRKFALRTGSQTPLPASTAAPRGAALLGVTLSGAAFLGTAMFGAALFGAQPAYAAAPRAVPSADPSPLVSLPGNTPSMARSSVDRGRAPASLSAHMLIVLKRTPEQERQLRELIAGQQDPASPNYHKWLSPEEFGRRFGVADSDVQNVTSYLASQGFALGRVYKNKMAIEATGTAAQIQSAFHTEVHQYSVGGRSFYANSRDPQIPAALAPVVAGFTSLIAVRANGSEKLTPATFDLTTHRARPLYDLPGTSAYGVSPADLSGIYNIPSSTSTYGQGGKGVNVGFVGDSNINLNFIANYRSTFGLPANNPVVVIDGDDPGVTSDAYIAYKQLELAGAVAPNASIYYYISATTDYDDGIDFAMIRAVEDNAVQVLGIGYQSCETKLASAQGFVSALWEQAAAEGMTVVAAAGNSGAAGCDLAGSSTGSTGGLAVNGYASSAYATAVGGTDFNYGTTPNYATYWKQGTTQYGSALGYIPEQVWNDSNTGTDSTAGTPYLLAGGGGLSSAGNDGVSSPTPQPSYQIGVVPSSISSTVRVLPDVSFFAGSGANNSLGYNNTAYLFCMSSSDCQTGASQPQFTLSGGTEASSAVFAGAMALVVEYQNTLHQPPSVGNPGLGNANPSLYYFVKNKVGTFHDITVGNNQVQCSSKNCLNGYTSGYAAASGYDAASGLGSFDITSLVSKWPIPNSTATTTTFAVTDPTTGNPVTTMVHSQPVNFTVQVSGSGGGVPSGDVAVFTTSPLASQAGQLQLTLSPFTTSGGAKVGQATYANDVFLPGGTYQIAARYAGDTTFAPSVAAPTTLTVTPEPSMIVIYGHNVNYSGSSIPYGSPVQITAEPYSTGNPSNVAIPSGSLQVYDGSSLITVVPIGSEGAATFSSNLLTVGTHSIVLKYLGDASFQPSQTSAFNFTVTSASTQTTLHPSTTNVGEGGSNDDGLTAVVISTTLPRNGSAPTGTVTFSTVPAQTATLVPGFDPNGNAIATASVQVSPTQVPATGVISATYNPGSGSNYTGSTSPQVQFTQTTSAYNGTSSISFTLTDANGTYPAQSGLSFPTSDTLTLNINVNTDTPSSSYVTVYANGTAISPQLWPDNNGNVVFKVPQQNGFLQLPSGQVQFTIQYDGWEEYIFGYPYYQSPPASTNLTVNITDNRTSADFSIQSATTSNQQSPLTASSPSASYALQLTSIYNFQSAYPNTPINLTCSIPNNPGLQCGFSNSAVTLGGSGFATSTLTVSAASGYTISALTPGPLPAHRWWFAGGGTALACVFLLGIPARRRNWQSMLGLLAIVAIAFGANGCGGSATHAFNSASSASVAGAGSNVTGQAGATVNPGVYPVIVTATATTNTTILHNLPVTVVVQ